MQYHDDFYYRDAYAPKLNITCDYGWVKLHPSVPVYDTEGRITGFNTRITDSKGRDEILEPVARIVYD